MGDAVVAEVRGRKVSFAGVGADGDVVLLIHGYGGDRNSWLFLQEPLATRYRVYALDLPGHGTSSKNLDVNVGSAPAAPVAPAASADPAASAAPAAAPAASADPADLLADAVIGVLDAIGASRAHLVGHALGGAVALAVTARDPGRIASVTLIAPSGFGRQINVGYLRGFADAQTRRELKPLVGELFADDKLVTRQVVDDLLAYKRLDGVEAALHALLDSLLGGDEQRCDSAAALAAIGDAVPVTVVWGRQDRIIPAEQAKAVAGAVRYVIEGAGHMPHLERPAEVQTAIEDTIARAG